jgi:hypothetical protein
MNCATSSNLRPRERADRDEHDTNFAAAVLRLQRLASGPLTDDEWDELFELQKKVANQGPDLFPA